jgi:hypothetical protein
MNRMMWKMTVEQACQPPMIGFHYIYFDIYQTRIRTCPPPPPTKKKRRERHKKGHRSF